MKRLTLIVVMLFMLGIGCRAASPSQRLPSIEDFEKADLVCTGTARYPDAQPGNLTVQLHAEKVIKGEVQAGPLLVQFRLSSDFRHRPPLFINVTMTESGEPLAAIPNGKRCLLFLKLRNSGVYSLLDPAVSVIDVVDTPDLSGDPTARLKRVLAETAAKAGNGDGLVAAKALRAWKPSGVEDIRLLKGIKRSSSSDGSSSGVEVEVIAMRLKAGDEGALDDALVKFSKARTENEANELLVAISSVDNTDLLHRIGMLFWSEDERIQRAAAQSLSKIRSRECFPYYREGLKSSI